MSEENLRVRASRVSGLLRQMWSQELADSDLEVETLGGLALAVAIERGWIEPDPALDPYLSEAEEALQLLYGEDLEERGDDDE